MAEPLDVAGRMAEGRPVVGTTQCYVTGSVHRGFRDADLTSHPRQLHDWYDAEADLDLHALDGDSATLREAAGAVGQVVERQRALAAELARAWRGDGGGAASDVVDAHCEAGGRVAGSLGAAAADCAALRDRLWRIVDDKVAAAIAIEDRSRDHRVRWLFASTAVATGSGDRDAAAEIVDGEVTPYVAEHIRHDWLTAMRDGTGAVGASFDATARAIAGRAGVDFAVPGDLTPMPPMPARTPMTPMPPARWPPADREASMAWDGGGVFEGAGAPPRGVSGVPSPAPGAGGAWPPVDPATTIGPAPGTVPAMASGGPPPAASAPPGVLPGGSGGMPPLGGSGVGGSGGGLSGIVGSLVDALGQLFATPGQALGGSGLSGSGLGGSGLSSGGLGGGGLGDAGTGGPGRGGEGPPPFEMPERPDASTGGVPTGREEDEDADADADSEDTEGEDTEGADSEDTEDTKDTESEDTGGADSGDSEPGDSEPERVEPEHVEPGPDAATGSGPAEPPAPPVGPAPEPPGPGPAPAPAPPLPPADDATTPCVMAADEVPQVGP